MPQGPEMGALVDDPMRLDQPLVRREGGQLQAVDWDTALGHLAEQLTRIRAEHDDYAIGSYSGTILDAAGRFYMEKLLRAIGSPSKYSSASIDSIAKVFVPKLMAGREGLSPAVDFDRTTFLLIIGENTVVSHGAFSYFPDPIRYLRTVKRHGEVWVLDPRRTETAKLATRHLTPRRYRLCRPGVPRPGGAPRRSRCRVSRGPRPQYGLPARFGRAVRSGQDRVDHGARSRRSERAPRVRPPPREAGRHHRHRRHHGCHRQRDGVDGLRPTDRDRVVRTSGAGGGSTTPLGSTPLGARLLTRRASAPGREPGRTSPGSPTSSPAR